MSSLFLEDLKTRSIALQRALVESRDDVNVDLFIQWRNCQQEIGEFLADEALAQIAKKNQAYIFANPTNRVSFAHFLRNDVQSKTYTIRERAARNGVCEGFMNESANYLKIPLKFHIGDREFFAVRRHGGETITQTLQPTDTAMNVCCYEDGLYIVSDIDLICIIQKHKDDKVIVDQQYGELTQTEKVIVEEINNLFLCKINQHFHRRKHATFRLIAHGPGNRFSFSQASHIHYPLNIYSPTKGKMRLGEECNRENSLLELLSFFRNLTSEGYQIHLNPNWNFNDKKI